MADYKTTFEQVEATILADYNEYYNAPFIIDGFKLPEDIIDRFRKSIWILNPNLHQVYMKKVKEILAKQPSELSFLEVGIVVNVICAVPFDRLYESLEEAMEQHEPFEELQKLYNKGVEDLNKKLQTKKMSLIKMAGLDSKSQQVKNNLMAK